MLISEFDLYKREWLSLVFKNRNQQYGAFELRSHYGSTMVKAMAITFFSVAAFGITETIISRSKPAPVIATIVDVMPPDQVYHEQKKKEEVKQQETKKIEPKQAPKATPRSTQNLNMVVKPDVLVKVDPKPVDPGIDSGPVDLHVDGPTGLQPIEGVDNGKGTDSGPAVDNSPKDPFEVQVMPEPFGGVNAWSKFLQKNLRYPAMAQEAGASGKVYMSFIIEKDGHLSDITVMRKVGYGFDEEATRVLKIAPAWKPGMQNGQAVRVRYTIPINFQLQDQ